jgi:hypothetical protein
LIAAVFLWGCFLPVRSARADLLVKSWDVNAPTLQRLYESLPPYWKPKGDFVYAETISSEEMVRISTFIYPETTDVQEFYENVIGLYLPKLDLKEPPNNLPEAAPMLFVTSGVSRADLPATFYHEYGHHVWHRLMTDSERDLFESLYELEKSMNTLPTEYSETSAKEAFAECYSCYIRKAPLEKTFSDFFDALTARLTGKGAGPAAGALLIPPPPPTLSVPKNVLVPLNNRPCVKIPRDKGGVARPQNKTM